MQTAELRCEIYDKEPTFKKDRPLGSMAVSIHPSEGHYGWWDAIRDVTGEGNTGKVHVRIRRLPPAASRRMGGSQTAATADAVMFGAGDGEDPTSSQR